HFSLLLPSAPPSALRSFPTRRSSDLLSESLTGVFNQPDRSIKPIPVGEERPRTSEPDSTAMDDPSSDSTLGSSIAVLSGSLVRRSEEHTSELQSRENLVCRLLLEKKK